MVAWRPDGSEIYFSTVGPGGTIFAVAADGSRIAGLARTGPPGDPVIGLATSFSLSPAGWYLVYDTCAYPDSSPWAEAPRWHHYQRELARVSTDGTGDTRLTTDDAFDSYPAWSPDARRIAFLSDRYDAASGRYPGWGLYTISVTGGDVRVIETRLEDSAAGLNASSDAAGRAGSDSLGGYVSLAEHPPQWSPDGRRLAFVGVEDDRRRAIYTVDAEGGDLRRLTETVSGPSWSPDGKRLAFAKPETNDVALYTIAADGSGAQRLTYIPRKSWRPQLGEPDPRRAWIELVAWSPDGSNILYACGGICVVAADGTPGSETPLPGVTAAWSPDGARIAMVYPERLNRTFPYEPLVGLWTPDGSNLGNLVVRDETGAFSTAGYVPRVPVDVAGCTSGTAVPEPAANPGLVHDCETLLGLRDVLAGTAELDWGSDRAISEWDGVVVGGSPPRVHELRLLGRRLRGMIPAAMGDLAQLRTLDLGQNFLEGTTPPRLGTLTELVRLDLHGNRLTGEIPSELGELTRLQALHLNNNQLTGPIRVELSRLADLTRLDLGVNRLTGTVPAALGQLASLEDLRLGNNLLTGPIPAQLGQLANLRRLSLEGNQLSGLIPVELGQLANLKRLSLAGNQLSGAIPVEFAQLAKLGYLHLADNQLSGPIPPELGQLALLTELSLSYNQLTGTVPEGLAQIEGLKLWLEGNQLTGCIPPGLRVMNRDRVGLSECGVVV